MFSRSCKHKKIGLTILKYPYNTFSQLKKGNLMATISNLDSVRYEATNSLISIYEHVEKVIDNSLKVFNALDWKWRGESITREMVNSQIAYLINTMQYEVINNIKSINDIDDKICATGGFELYIRFDVQGEFVTPHCELQLVAVREFAY